jgi:hypothetical protein
MDALPTLGSDKLVSSGGIATALVNQKTEIMNELEISEHFTAPTEKVQVLGNSSGAVNIDCSLGNLVTCTATGNITFAFTANTPAGQSRVLTIILTNGGAYTVTWPTSVDWPDATAPTLAATGISILSFITVDNGATWYGMLSR